MTQVNKPLKKRFSPGYAARKAAKREDRSNFRQQAQQGFSQLSNGLRTIDYAVVGVYEALVNFRTLQVALDIAYVLALLFAFSGVATYIVVSAGSIAYAGLALHIFRIRKRALNAKEQAYIAALNAANQRQLQQAVAVTPPTPEPVVDVAGDEPPTEAK